MDVSDFSTASGICELICQLLDARPDLSSQLLIERGAGEIPGLCSGYLETNRRVANRDDTVS